METRYLAPDPFTRRLLNPFVRMLSRLGVSLVGSRVLAVRGRTSGEWRTTPVNVLEVDGGRYLMAPRGETQWVRNIRVAAGGELRHGRRAEVISVTEVADADKGPLMREYLRRWAFEAGQFFPGLSKTSTDAELLAAAPGFPCFEISR